MKKKKKKTGKLFKKNGPKTVFKFSLNHPVVMMEYFLSSRKKNTNVMNTTLAWINKVFPATTVNFFCIFGRKRQTLFSKRFLIGGSRKHKRTKPFTISISIYFIWKFSLNLDFLTILHHLLRSLKKITF